MSRAFPNRLGVLVAAVAVAALAIGCGAVDSGTVLEVTEHTITVTDEASSAGKTYPVPADANVLKDGQPVALEDIEPGDDVSVTVSQDAEGNQVASVVSAESNSGPEEAAPTDGGVRQDEQPLGDAPSETGAVEDADASVDQSMSAFEGDVTAAGDNKLTLSDPEGTPVTFIVNDQTEITLDGAAAELNAIGAGFVVVVKAREEADALIAVEIEAASPLSTPEQVEDPQREDSEPGAGEQPDRTDGSQF